MKSLVLKSLRQPKNIETLKIDSTHINIDQNLEICIYSTCNLKSIKGYDFCYKHFKSYHSNEETGEYRIQLSKNEINNKEKSIANDECEVSYTTKTNPFDNVISEPNFLYEDFLKKEKFKQTLEINDKSESDLEESGEIHLKRSGKKKDYDFYLSKAAIYSKNEIIKIFKSKLVKLNYLYQQQLSILHDNILINRKKYLTMRSNEESVARTSTSGKSAKLIDTPELSILKRYKKQSKHKMYLKRKFDGTNIKALDKDSSAFCQFISPNDSSMKCLKKPLPLSNFCINHILNDKNQVLFYKCPGNPNTSEECQKPLIESIGLNCPIHISNKFINSNLNLSEEIIQNSIDISLNYDLNQNDGDENEMNENSQESDQTNHYLNSLINNVKLISVIKEEKIDDFNDQTLEEDQS